MTIFRSTLVYACLLASAANAQVASPPPRSLAEELPGSLVIAGGGELPNGVWKWFMRLAGEARNIVVIPTASERADTEDSKKWVERLIARGARSVTVLHTRSRDEANRDAFVAPLKSATGVWISGGVQNRVTDAYRGTRVEAELHALLARGGVIGGTSAGAACITEVMIAGGRSRARIEEGFGFLPGSVVDQHFLTRNREGRLAGVLQAHPGLVGFGIDEGTAMVIDGRRGRGRAVRVIGESKLVVLHAPGAGRDASKRVFAAKGGRFARVVADFVALRRDAIARTKPAYPPAKPAVPYLANGTVMMVGGGVTRELVDRFIAEAGGPDAPIVFVPTANGAPRPGQTPGFVRTLRRAGAKRVTVVHETRKAKIETEAFLAPLRNARGIWFGGGRQWRLVDAYEGTTALKLFHDVLARGGVIGGSSAGTSIQAGYMVRGNPLGNTDMMAAGYERGFGFLGGVAVDQHFTQRNRHADLEKVVARFPQLVCIGVDENTAIVVQKSTMEVVGQHQVAVFDHRRGRPANGAPAYVTLHAGDRYDLAAGKASTGQ